MPNPIKYSTGSETLALKKGDFYIGTGDVGKGPTSTTGYYNGITPPSGGYTIYLNKASGGPSIYTASNDAQLISLTNSIAGASYTTANECLVYFAGQTDKIVCNRDYEPIVTDGLVMNLDAGFTPSYPKNGTTWYDVSTNTNNGTLVNGPSFSSGDGGSIVFDGVDDYASCNFTIGAGDFTFSLWIKKPTNTSNIEFVMGSYADNTVRGVMLFFQSGNLQFRVAGSPSGGYVQSNLGNITDGTWKNITCSVTRTGNMISYINGVPAVTTNASTQQGSIPNGSFIGGFVELGWFTSGNLAIVSSYTKALSASEVLQNYNAQKSRFGL
jgi:hypothetical protein